MDINNDKLMQDILRMINEGGGKNITATGIINRMYNTHGADSNHRHYRKVLRRLNWLWINEYIDAHQVNAYSAIRWFSKHKSQVKG